MASLQPHKLEPVYRAMSLCSRFATVARTNTEYEDGQFLKQTITCLEASKKVISCSSDKNLLTSVSKDDIQLSFVLLTILARLIDEAVEISRKKLPGVCETYRDLTAAVIDDLEAAGEDVQDIAEAWHLALDDEWLTRVSQAREELLSKKKDGSLTDWRRELAAI